MALLEEGCLGLVGINCVTEVRFWFQKASGSSLDFLNHNKATAPNPSK